MTQHDNRFTATYRIKHIGLAQFGFEISRAGQNEAGDVRLVVRDEEPDSLFRHFADVVVPLLVPEASKSESRLSSSSMFLRQVHCESVQYVPCVSLQCSKKRAVSIHDNESELIVIGQEGGQGFRMKLVITEI